MAAVTSEDLDDLDVETGGLPIEAFDGVELAHDENTRLCCGYGRLADHLWPMTLRRLVAQPLFVAKVWFGTNVGFVGIGKMVSGLCWLLTTPGFLLLLGAGLYGLVYNIARAATYPGFLSSVKRSLEQDVAKFIHESIRQSLYLCDGLYEATCRSELLNDQRNGPPAFAIEKIQAAFEQVERQCKGPIQSMLESLEHFHKNNSVIGGSIELMESIEALLVAKEQVKVKVIDPMKASLKLHGPRAAFNVLSPFLSKQAFDPSTGQTFQDIRVTRQAPQETACPDGDCSTLDEFNRALHRVKLCAAYLEEGGWIKSTEGLNADLGVDNDEATIFDSDEEQNELDPIVVDVDIESPGTDIGKTLVASEPVSGISAAFQTLSKVYHDYLRSRAPMHAIANIDFVREELVFRLNASQEWIAMSDGTQIDALFLPAASKQQYPDQRTVIYCGPNCGLYEFSRYQNSWSSFYTSLGFNVLLYNYRGYGRSKGWPSPNKLRSDGEEICAFLASEKGVRPGWIGIHAESIGGVVACHLAGKAQKLGISFVIADRTFANLPVTATHLVGSWAGKAMRNLVWVADNVEGLLSAPPELHCLIACDPEDEIIHNNASLKAGVASRLIRAVATEDELEDVIREKAQIHLGASEALAWSLDILEFELIGIAYVKLVEAGRVRTKLHSVAPQLFGPLQNLLRILWFSDGRCGEALGRPLAEFYGLWKSDAEEIEETHDASALPYLTIEPSAKRAVAEERAGSLMVWFQTAIVWGRASHIPAPSPQSTRVPSKHYSLCGEQGSCGLEQKVPLETLVRLLKLFRQNYSRELELTQLLSSVDILSSRLSQTLDVIARARPLTSNISLLPLNSGHNTAMNPREEAVVKDLLAKAGWTSS